MDAHESRNDGGAFEKLGTCHQIGLMALPVPALLYARFGWEPTVLISGHALMAQVGALALLGAGVVVARLAKFAPAAGRARRVGWRALHAGVQLSGLAALWVAVAAAYTHRATAGRPHLASLHAWCGAAFFVLVHVEAVVGAALWLVLAGASPIRLQPRRLRALHLWLSRLAFVLAAAALALGATEMHPVLPDLGALAHYFFVAVVVGLALFVADLCHSTSSLPQDVLVAMSRRMEDTM